MRAFWVDREKNMAQTVKTDGTLSDLYEMCHCRCIEITVLSMRGRLFNVVVDEEGLLTENPMATVFDGCGEPMLFGSVVFFGCDEETGDLASLDGEQMDILLNNTGMAIMTDFTSRCVTIAR